MAFGPGGFPPQTLAEKWNGRRWRIQRTPVLPGITDLSNFSVACPSRSICMAAGGFENDGPGAKSLTELWRATRASSALAATGVSSQRTGEGILACVRAAVGKGLALGPVAATVRQRLNIAMLQLSRAASAVEQLTSTCTAG
jgi:hypothetical protein